MRADRSGIFPGKVFFRRFLLLLVLVYFSPVVGPAAVKKKGDLVELRTLLNTPYDSRLSPYTGYTRAHWLEITEKLIAGVMPYVNPETGMPELPQDPEEPGHYRMIRDPAQQEVQPLYSKMEALERTMMLSVVYTAATGKDRVPGYQGSISAPFLKGIIRGTDPEDPVYWGRLKKYDSTGSVFALGVLLSPRYFWDPLTDKQKHNLLEYFKDLAYTFSYDCNHWYFHMMPVPVLDRHGVDSNREFLTEMFDRTLNWYRGDGWFLDGGNRSFDLYNLWGFQLFNHALIRFDQRWNSQFGDRIRHTTAHLLECLPYLFGRDGGPVPWGRSTTYRFACISAIGWPVLNGASTLPPGQARRIASGCLKYFWDHGCMSENGLLELGYRGANTVVPEIYHDTGSAYWAAQGLICLLIPESDPFWREVEKPMPADQAGGRVVLPGAQMLVRVSPIDGEARLFPVGQPFSHWGRWQRGIKYCQYAYSSYLGYCATGEGGPDLGAGRTGASFDGQEWCYRERPLMIQVTADHLVSVDEMKDFSYELKYPDYYDWGHIVTHTLVGNSGEVHVFWHDSPRPAYLYLGGYGISVPHGGRLESERQGDCLTIHGGENHSIIKVLQAPPGKLDFELLEPRPGWKHSHNFGGRGAFPHWQSGSPVRSNTVVAVYVDGTRGRIPIDPSISLHADKGLLRITFEGKTHLVRIPD